MTVDELRKVFATVSGNLPVCIMVDGHIYPVEVGGITTRHGELYSDGHEYKRGTVLLLGGK